LLVQLPPDAKLFVDGREVNLTPEIRNVLTPELTPGRDYYYTLMVQAVRGGKPVEETRRVVVRAGQASPADFRDLGVASQELPSAKPARITVRIPEGARLYVDGVAKPVTGGRQTFNTPVLEPGKSYYYTFKAEFGQESQIPAETQRVIVEAGKDVAVNFSNQKLVLTAQR
jgi:uncharacterized protein (TIGR03000 family)